MVDEELLKNLRKRIEELDLFKVREELTSTKELSIYLLNENLQGIYYYLLKGGFSGNPAFLEILSYLFNVEGVLTFCVDKIIYYLIKYEHHDIFLERNNKFVTEFEDLSKITLNEKVLFLEKHGFNNFSSLFNRQFRNAIAHLTFLSSMRQTSPSSIIQYSTLDGKKKKLKEVTLKQIQEWNLNIQRFHAYFNNQFNKG